MEPIDPLLVACGPSKLFKQVLSTGKENFDAILESLK